MMTEESEPSPGYLRDWSSHEAIRSLTEQVGWWRVATALVMIAGMVALIGVLLWNSAFRC